MKVLFLMFAFPDMNKSFNLYTAIVQEFHQNGHEVYVLAPEMESRKTAIHKEAGINVLRIKTLPIKNVPNYLKGIANVFLPYQFGRALRKCYPNVQFDLIISPTPPITLVDIAAKLKVKYKAIFYLILRDIFPQNAVDLGFMKKKGLIHFYFRKKEKKLYEAADHIGCMSDRNINYIVSNNPTINKSKLHVLRNYQVLYTQYGNKDIRIRAKYNLLDKFVVVFGGNMGKAQQLENVLKLAIACQEFKDVIFLLLGDGLQMSKLEIDIQQSGIKNIVIRKTIAKQEYQDLISTCDIGLISLHKDFTIPNIPSKSLDYFNVGLPVLASIDAATDYGQILDDANAGLWSYAGDNEAFKSNFDRLYFNQDLRKTLGENGRKYFETYLTTDIAYQTIISNVKQRV
jgi:glycosyltransferase involved in cell wall biosynthesis